MNTWCTRKLLLLCNPRAKGIGYDENHMFADVGIIASLIFGLR